MGGFARGRIIDSPTQTAAANVRLAMRNQSGWRDHSEQQAKAGGCDQRSRSQKEKPGVLSAGRENNPIGISGAAAHRGSGAVVSAAAASAAFVAAVACDVPAVAGSAAGGVAPPAVASLGPHSGVSASGGLAPVSAAFFDALVPASRRAFPAAAGISYRVWGFPCSEERAFRAGVDPSRESRWAASEHCFLRAWVVLRGCHRCRDHLLL